MYDLKAENNKKLEALNKLINWCRKRPTVAAAIIGVNRSTVSAWRRSGGGTMSFSNYMQIKKLLKDHNYREARLTEYRNGKRLFKKHIIQKRDLCLEIDAETYNVLDEFAKKTGSTKSAIITALILSLKKQD